MTSHQIDAVVPLGAAGSRRGALIKTIVKLAGTKVDFREISVVGPATTAPPGRSPTGLTFTFNATYGNLQSFLAALDAL